MTIEWEKIKNAPSKAYKILGSDLLSLDDKIEQLQNIRNELTKKIDSIEGTIKNLLSENSEKNGQIKTLQDKVAKLNELINALETTISNKDESMGNVMNMHANFMKEIERLNEDVARNQEEISDLKKKNSELEVKKSKLDTEKAVLRPKISELQKTLSQLEDKIPSLERQLSQEQNEVTSLKNSNSELLDEVANLKNSNNELQAVIQTKESNLKESDEKINNLTTKIAELNARIEELKDQIPKKVVHEKADEVVRGTGCPHCGFTVNEEYKIIDGKKQLLRKYCLNPNCGWNIQETPREALAVELEADVPEDAKIIKIFEVTKEGLEEVSSLNSQMVAIIADTVQDIIWIWRGSDSNRFIYAEATREVGKVKNEIMKLSRARIERIEEGSEPDNFQISL